MRQEPAQEISGQCGFLFWVQPAEGGAAPSFFSEKRGLLRQKFLRQGKKKPGFLCITVGRGGFPAVSRVHIDSDAFVDGSVLLRQVIIVFIILVEMV